MAEQTAKGTALAGLRVLEIADERGIYTGKLMADLGADVIKIEKPGGDATRNMPPYLHEEPGTDRSLFHLLFNTNKRGITLDIESADGQEIFKKLAKTADIVIETGAPGYMKSLGLDYAVLSEINPGLVMASITPFGQDGPYKDYKASDITANAMAGQLFLTGEPERPPVQTAGLTAYHMVGSVAAVGVMTAIHYRDMTGLGQYIDVSMQEAILAQLEVYSIHYLYDDLILDRIGSSLPFSVPSRLYPCQDGYFHVICSRPYQWHGLIDWIGGEAQAFADPKYDNGRARMAIREQIDKIVGEWGKDFTKDYLFHEGQRRRICFAASNTPQEVIEDPHLNARGFFVDVEHAETGQLRYPGPPYMFHGTPWGVRRPAPQVGEHNKDIYGEELGLTKADLAILKSGSVI